MQHLAVNMASGALDVNNRMHLTGKPVVIGGGTAVPRSGMAWKGESLAELAGLGKADFIRSGVRNSVFGGLTSEGAGAATAPLWCGNSFKQDIAASIWRPVEEEAPRNQQGRPERSLSPKRKAEPGGLLSPEGRFKGVEVDEEELKNFNPDDLFNSPRFKQFMESDKLETPDIGELHKLLK